MTFANMLERLFRTKTNLSGEDANTTGGLDFFLGLFAKESGFDDDWLVWEFTFGKDFIDVVSGAVNDWSFRFASVFLSDVFTNEGPQVVNVDGWAEVLVLFQVKVSHTDFTKVTWMVFVEVDSVVMLTTSQTSSTWMLSVFTNSSVTVADLASHFSGLSSVGRHVCLCLSVSST